jgi:tRNA pseudouridine38-40 synthase
LFFRYFIRLGYKGTHYHGWQIQPGAITIQEVLNKQLSMLLREEIYSVGAGRTDTGVHAPCFYAHFDSTADNLHADREKFIYKLNAVLPTDIAVYDLFKVTPEAHARFSALSRTYLYRICRNKDPFTYDFCHYLSKPLDIDKMNEAAKILFEYIDFTSFSKLHTDVKTNNCKILEAHWEISGNELQFYISADRFLRNMVRAIVGTCVSVGEHKTSIDQFREIIESKNRSEAGVSIAAKGLHLINIDYPSDIYV